MLKKIPVQKLTLGMHLQAFCGAWLDHPFWCTKFVLTDPNDLELILGSSIKEVWIDVSKGLDADPGESDGASDPVSTEAVPPAPPALERTGFADEVVRAAKICARGKEAVVSMFQEARMGKAIDAEAAAPLVEEISNSVLRNPGALISLARLKNADDYTYMHSVAVCALMIALARQLQLDEETTRRLGLAGLLHDLGKAAMPMDVLNKPGKLTDSEFGTMRSHPEKGAQMLLECGQISALVLDVCLHHHEKVDGSGYPHRLQGDQISLMAKMGAVCDVYDAITSNRPYKQGWDPAESIRKMAEWKGHFDEAVFQAFVKTVGIYPVGALVRLQSGRLAVVMEQNPKALLAPRVKVFFSAKSRLPLPQSIVDLSKITDQDRIVGRESAEEWGFKNIEELWSGLAARSGSYFD